MEGERKEGRGRDGGEPERRGKKERRES